MGIPCGDIAINNNGMHKLAAKVANIFNFAAEYDFKVTELSF